MWQTPWRLSHLLKSHGKRCVLGMETIRNFTSHQIMEDTQVLMVLWNSYPMVDEHPCFHAKCVESALRSGGKTDGYRTRTMASSAFGRCPYVRVTFWHTEVHTENDCWECEQWHTENWIQYQKIQYPIFSVSWYPSNKCFHAQNADELDLDIWDTLIFRYPSNNCFHAQNKLMNWIWSWEVPYFQTNPVRGRDKTQQPKQKNGAFIVLYPIGSMYGIYANIWGILMVNVTIYTIHGSYGYRFQNQWIWVIDMGCVMNIGAAFGSLRFSDPMQRLSAGHVLAMQDTLWLCQNSYWKWPLIVDLPIKNCDFP